MLKMMVMAMMLKVMMVRMVKVMMMIAMIAIVRISPNVHSAGSDQQYVSVYQALQGLLQTHHQHILLSKHCKCVVVMEGYDIVMI